MLFRFEKKGDMRYISHLDLQRLFRRVFKRAGLETLYSAGFNPQPKIMLVQPLSLGFESEGEYLEVDTPHCYDIGEVMRACNASLPSGIRLLEGKAVDFGGKSASALVEYATYSLDFAPWDNCDAGDPAGFCHQKELLVEKRRKSGKTALIDVKPLILTWQMTASWQEGLQVHCMLKSAGNESLNPLLPIQALRSYCGLPQGLPAVAITRLELFGKAGKSPLPLLDCLPQTQRKE